MTDSEKNKIWDAFLSKELKKRRKGKGSYLHFDYKRNLFRNTDFYKDYLGDTNTVARHSFLPFLKIHLESKKYKLNKDGKRSVQIKPRPILYSSHFDALIFSYYSSILNYYYENFLMNKSFKNSVLAYRAIEKKSNINFAKEAFENIINIGECTVMALDVKSFFEDINHKVLKDKWKEIVDLDSNELPIDHYKIYRSLTKYAFVEKKEIISLLNISNSEHRKLSKICSLKAYKNIVRYFGLIRVNNSKKGIPQGSQMSGLLSNISMLDFDKFTYNLLEKFHGTYFRYSDDILLIVPRDQDYKLVKSEISDFIDEKLNLKMNLEKEVIASFKYVDDKLICFKEGTSTKMNLQYLGFEFNGSQVFLRSSSLSRYHVKMKKGIYNTVKRSLGKGSKENKVRRKRIYMRYTHVGNSNFLSYAYKAASVFEDIDKFSIRNQVKGHVNKVEKTIEKKITFRKRKMRKKESYLNKK
jgi:hypothetical protein